MESFGQSRESADPFILLKECVEMTKYMGQANATREGISMKQEENMQNYSSMIEANFENRYDAAAIEAKMAKLKFAKKDTTPAKNSDWFKQMDQI